MAESRAFGPFGLDFCRAFLCRWRLGLGLQVLLVGLAWNSICFVCGWRSEVERESVTMGLDGSLLTSFQFLIPSLNRVKLDSTTAEMKLGDHQALAADSECM